MPLRPSETKQLRLFGNGSRLPDLPKIALTKEGTEYRPAEMKWIIHDGGAREAFIFDRHTENCTERHLHALKLFLVVKLKQKSLTTCFNIFERYLALLRHVVAQNGAPVDVLTVKDVLSYRQSLSSDREWMLGSIRASIRDWVAMGYEAIESEVPKALYQIKLKRNKSGVAVRTMDPHKGPFNDEEFQDIIHFNLDSYDSGEASLSDMVLTNLFLVHAARPVSLAALRLRDFTEELDANTGVPKYFLDIPKAKRQTGGRRTDFNHRKLTPEIGITIKALAEEVKMRFAEKMKGELNPDDLPMFCSDDPEAGYASNAKAISRKLLAHFARGKGRLFCRRLGHESEPLKIHARRFRFTVGTRLANEGAREMVIAEALGHTTTSSVTIYCKAKGKIRERVNNIMEKIHEPIVPYFNGKIIETEAEAERSKDPSSRIRSFEGNLKGDVVGNCGKSGFCGGFVPLPCYKCKRFQPLLEAPHEDVLKWLLFRRIQLEEQGMDDNIVKANDDVIMAVADVTRRCRDILRRREETGKAIGHDC